MVNSRAVLAIVGPTAAGKSELALRLAAELDGEIVSADSRQVYRHMDVGTAKPTADQLSAVRHHLVDVVEPDEEYSLALFLEQARSAIADIHERQRLPIVVGGTGQYVWGLLEGWQTPQVPPEAGLRHELNERLATRGLDPLVQELAALDPEAAERVDRRNPRRVVRALEVARTGPAAEPPRKESPPWPVVTVGLTLDRAALDRRIDERVDAMVAAGWVAEVEALLTTGYGPELPSMSGLGYREIAKHLQSDTSLEEAVAEVKRRTRRFARKQYAWFKTDDERISWFDVTSSGLNLASEHAISRIAALAQGT